MMMSGRGDSTVWTRCSPRLCPSHWWWWKSAARRSANALVAVLYFLGGLYYLLSSPPLHLVYEPLPPAGPRSVYVPGGGFSGFWWHLGYFQRHMAAVAHSEDTAGDGGGYEYYCYSSGCLSLIAAHLNVSVDDTFGACQSLQRRWLNGTLSRYDLVARFLEELLPPAEYDVEGMERALPDQGPTRWRNFLSRLHVLVTTAGDGVRSAKARDREHLVELLLQTTWIPLVTGRGLAGGVSSSSAEENHQDRYLDGGFSRTLHPPCRHEIRVPNTWDSVLYTLHPGMGQMQAYRLWEHGQSAPPLERRV